MRIQHNIAAMNSYRNYNNTASALSKNLEKLSSGYKINRAGDDAAGLAISEKMRAQITGLETATKNVKDGISLVKTAEGATQEIHDMLNRMEELATQSANGTYDNGVDRQNLQKEVKALRTEIDRIASTANFNGIKLLDGEWDAKTTEFETVENDTLKMLGALPKTYEVALSGTATTLAAGDKIKIGEFEYELGNGSGDIDIATDTGLADQIQVAVDLYNAEDGILYEAEYDSTNNKIIFTPKEGTTGSDAAPEVSITTNADIEAAAPVAVETEAEEDLGTQASFTVDMTAYGNIANGNKVIIGDYTYTHSGAQLTTAAAVASAVLTDITTNHGGEVTIDGQTWVVTADANDAENLVFTQKTAAEYDTDGQATTIAAAFKKNTSAAGVTVNAIDDGVAPEGGDSDSGSGGINLEDALVLQIGDTSENNNKLGVSIASLMSSAMKIDQVDVGTQDGASTAINTIKVAINYVSSVRGDLGAVQNRLEHTQNNLSVMTENIQDAESTIRDTDVADEMMEYTKNNILLQSAQAMLAQANQMPQGVLQLLG